MIDNPFLPKLFNNHVVPYDIYGWSGNSIWLPKQPLFMWQMALSMKVFGVNEFTIRLPSVLLGSLTILLVYRITSILANDKKISIVAGLLICFSNYQLEIISGQKGMDHNDLSFSFYILASFWAFSEKLRSEKLIWNILIGFFAGCAVLNKWLVGLLVFLPYGILVLSQFYNLNRIKIFSRYLLSLLVCLLVFMPWQVYIMKKFKSLAFYEYNYNSKHIFEAIEGHKGSSLFYLENFNDYFGSYIWVFILIGVFVSLKNKLKFDISLNNSLIASFLVVLLFFSVIVKTKLPNYFYIVVPFGIIYISIGLKFFMDKVRLKIVNYIILGLIIITSLNPKKSIATRRNNNYRENQVYNTHFYKILNQLIPPHVKLVINMNSFENIDVMFYNKDITAYHWWFDVKHLDSLKSNKVWIGAFRNHGSYNLPAEYTTYPYLYIIDIPLKSIE